MQKNGNWVKDWASALIYCQLKVIIVLSLPSAKTGWRA
jgi:hypothetical protein